MPPIGRARPEIRDDDAISGRHGACRRARVPSSSSAPAASSALRTCRCISASSFPSRASTTSTPPRRTRPRAVSVCPTCSRRSPKPRPQRTRSSTWPFPAIRSRACLKDLPRGSAVLIQKPMGEDLAAARSIVEDLPRARARRRDELSAAVQSERAGASRSASAPGSLARSSTSKCGWS